MYRIIYQRKTDSAGSSATIEVEGEDRIWVVGMFEELLRRIEKSQPKEDKAAT